MPVNPLFKNATSPNDATAPGNNVNDSYKRYKRGYNKFDLSRPFYNTERYADINLIECLEGVEGDKLTFGNKHEIRTYTMKSQQMFDLFKKKTFFMVDNKAILPVNWEKVYKQPNKGDDVADDVNCLLSGMLSYINTTLFRIKEGDILASGSSDNLNYVMRFILFLESIFSNGSLLASMNCHLSSLLQIENYISFDSALQALYESIGDVMYVKFPQLSSNLFTAAEEPSVNTIKVSKNTLFDYLRTFPDFEVTYADTSYYRTLYTVLLDFVKHIQFKFDPANSELDDVFNLSRLVAYQLVCNQFYTNDSVDNIYNAETWMSNAKSLALEAISSTGPFWPTFVYNGVKTDYDVFSGYIMNRVIDTFTFNIGQIDYNRAKSAYYYLHLLFFYRKSLRFGDYFVGSKTLPYAPGDVVADVVNGGVSALDMTRKLLMQRFLNSVERVSNTWKDYLAGVTDGVAPPNVLEPRFLASSTSHVSGFEVENTSEEQGKIVTLLKSQNSNYVYELEVGSPCIVIGVSTYEVQRVYSKTTDRFFKHRDRFDMFNKFMQNIGDQEIYLGERSSNFSWSRVFGYTPRHMEYKQRYPICAGGFVENLPGYAFITDNGQSGQSDDGYTDGGVHISPFYIRNKNSEFDRFFSSLSGLTLASYFHFEVKYNCICHAVRQMEYSPTIL